MNTAILEKLAHKAAISKKPLPPVKTARTPA
jgi:hypothetical protein